MTENLTNALHGFVSIQDHYYSSILSFKWIQVIFVSIIILITAISFLITHNKSKIKEYIEERKRQESLKDTLRVEEENQKESEKKMGRDERDN